ncbi:uncharacterized protein LAESUDRAFT_732560, partial [Laetiporus sulphureus 93-53]
MCKSMLTLDDERRRRIAKGLTPSPEIPKDPSADSRREGEAEKIPSSDTGWEQWVMPMHDSESGEGVKTSAADNPYAPTQSSQSLSSQIPKQVAEHEIDVNETLLFGQAIDELHTEG